jgi:hypothetical protein
MLGEHSGTVAKSLSPKLPSRKGALWPHGASADRCMRVCVRRGSLSFAGWLCLLEYNVCAVGAAANQSPDDLHVPASPQKSNRPARQALAAKGGTRTHSPKINLPSPAPQTLLSGAFLCPPRRRLPPTDRRFESHAAALSAAAIAFTHHRRPGPCPLSGSHQ